MPSFGSYKSAAGRLPEYDRLLDTLAALPILDGRLIEDVSLSMTETLVSHKLFRDYRGWIVVNTDTAATVHVSSEERTDSFLALTASAPCVVSLWVF